MTHPVDPILQNDQQAQQISQQTDQIQQLLIRVDELMNAIVLFKEEIKNSRMRLPSLKGKNRAQKFHQAH